MNKTPTKTPNDKTIERGLNKYKTIPDVTNLYTLVPECLHPWSLF